jgi:predicted nucleic acid-binding Zn ribbon protein
MLRCQRNGSPDTDRPGAASAREAPLDPRLVEVSPEGARAPVDGAPAEAGDLRCPICGRLLRARQRVCSGRCRAELSRRRQAEARQARDQAVRALLLAALDLIGKDGQP